MGYFSTIYVSQIIFDEDIPIQHSVGNYGSARGVDTFTCNLNSSLQSLRTGMEFYVRFFMTNTGVSTLNFNNVGAVPLRKWTNAGKTDLAPNDIDPNRVYHLIYDGNDLMMNAL